MHNKHVILYIHGFGMKKDDRGLLTDIAAAFPESINILTDMNIIDEEYGSLIVEPITKQVQKMNEVFKSIQATYPDAHIDIVAHSQGCIITSLLDQILLTQKIIFLAPPFSFDRERTADTFRNREGTIINFEGTSKFIRRDGSTTYVPSEYWKDREQYNPIQLIQSISTTKDVYIILAENDNVVKNTLPSQLENNIHLKVETIPGNHNFDKEARIGLVNKIKNILT